ncbi:MAG: SBBP repeat-containing protein [Pseudomonadota bacterium]
MKIGGALFILLLIGCGGTIDLQENGSAGIVGSDILEAKGGGGKIRRTPTPTPTATQVPPVNSGNGLVWSTYIGGAGFDDIRGVTADSAGNIYVVGGTQWAAFPKTVGQSLLGLSDAFVMKLSSSGSLIWSRLIGGTNGESGRGVAVGASGNVYVTGETTSTDLVPASVPGFQRTLTGNEDAFVAKLSPDGATLHYITYFGRGTGGLQEWGNFIAVDSSGCATIAGLSAALSTDSFVAKFTADGSGLVYSTYIYTVIGGLAGLALDSQGRAVVAGRTNSHDFPTRGQDGFLLKLNSTGTAFVFSIFLGGSTPDGIDAVRLDAQDNIYVAGYTTSLDFPTTPGVFMPLQTNAYHDAFVTKFSPDASQVLVSTRVGGRFGDDAVEILLGPAGQLILVGNTNSDSFPVTAGAFDITYNGIVGAYGDTIDGFLTALKPDGTGPLLYSTYFGAIGDISRYGWLDAAAMLPDGKIVMVGRTDRAGIPVTVGAMDTTFNGGMDGFISVFDAGL